MASKVTKIYTGLAGLPVCQEPVRELSKWYGRLLRRLDELPKESEYRKVTENLVKSRKSVVESTTEPMEIENKLGAQCEELIEEVKKELNLVEHMKKYKPWENLEEKPSADQWKWPM